MRPVAGRKDPHHRNLQGDDGAGQQANGNIQPCSAVKVASVLHNFPVVAGRDSESTAARAQRPRRMNSGVMGA